ncbi:hypothetical protein FisN_15Hh121 [Fistulifera solaris]|uniref:START domain-containing protein n=1 Tax=Fistulifera solaris TaxID=1519565 RepID=A0A1Z5K9N1_FISSO|nr:hypothetical protein FisN_15Hh121 [Fistulifera solaris]|eukprot:GAX22983.1 hypothetical protein FisN_15Hh121 [Fistulifera solaris]
MKGFRFLLLIGVSFVHFEAVTCQTNHPAASKPQRGKTLSSPILAHDLYQAYRELQSEYQTKAAKGDWKLLYEKEGVEVCLLQHPEDPTCPYVRMKGIFPVPVEECWNFLSLSNWDTSMPKMDPFYEGVSLHGSYQHDQVRMILCRKRTKRLLAFGKRDLVFLSVQDEPLSDGTWVSGTLSVKTDLVPRQPGYTRAFQDSIAFYKPLQENTQTELTIMCRIDLNDSAEDGTGGFIPMWLYVKTIGKTGAQSVIRMRNALLQEKCNRDDKQSSA